MNGTKATNKFEKLNRDIYNLAKKMLEDQELCKLIHYSGQFPLTQPDISGTRLLLGKKVLPFKSKIPRPDEQGTYILIRPENIRGSKGGNLISSQLVFEIYTSETDGDVYDEDGDIADRVALIMSKIDKFMINSGLSIGKNSFGMAGSIGTRNSEFTGYSMVYNDIDFREISGE